MNNTTRLIAPYQLGALHLPNRTALAPMTRTSATDSGHANDRMVKYYKRFAEGGFGLIITEGLYPDHEASQSYINQPGIADESQAMSWQPIVDAIHQAGGKVIAQLMHAGALVQHDRFIPIAPSAIKPKGAMLEDHGGKGDFAVPRAMTKAEINRVVSHFASAAERAQRIGFDGVEIHAANGYLLDQFLTDYSNKRTDEYGGNTEHRVKLCVEILSAIRETVRKDFIVGIRISQGKVNDFHHKWAAEEDDAAIIFSSLAVAHADYIHTTEYNATAPAFRDNSATLSSLAKKHSGLPVIANGKLGDPQFAVKMLQSGECDVVAIGTSALVNPDWPRKASSGLQLETFRHEWLLPIATLREDELL